jgi:hypothetical protein
LHIEAFLLAFSAAAMLASIAEGCLREPPPKKYIVLTDAAKPHGSWGKMPTNDERREAAAMIRAIDHGRTMCITAALTGNRCGDCHTCKPRAIEYLANLIDPDKDGEKVVSE